MIVGLLFELWTFAGNRWALGAPGGRWSRGRCPSSAPSGLWSSARRSSPTSSRSQSPRRQGAVHDCDRFHEFRTKKTFGQFFILEFFGQFSDNFFEPFFHEFRKKKLSDNFLSSNFGQISHQTFFGGEKHKWTKYFFSFPLFTKNWHDIT
jgi:hypothetical protein